MSDDRPPVSWRLGGLILATGGVYRRHLCATWLLCFATRADSPGYGFTDPPNNYDDEGTPPSPWTFWAHIGQILDTRPDVEMQIKSP
ncbi:MAG: hypothetical protein ABSD11_17810 [Methylocella sp.]|jgi:hypothetical protein